MKLVQTYIDKIKHIKSVRVWTTIVSANDERKMFSPSHQGKFNFFFSKMKERT